MNWDEAQAYVKWLSRTTGQRYRLLSESEWEYAARSGTQTCFSWGDDPSGNAICGFANGAGSETSFDWRNQACRDGHERTAPVGRFGANRFGLHDIHGNVNVNDWVGPLERQLRGGRRPTDRHGARASVVVACFAAVPGATVQRSSARRSAVGTTPGTGTSSSASVWLGPFDFLPLYLFTPWGSGGAAPSSFFEESILAFGSPSMSRSSDNARRTGPAIEAIYRFLLWLVPAVETFPRSQKFLLGDRLQATALDVLERLVEATYNLRSQTATGTTTETGTTAMGSAGLARSMPEPPSSQGGRDCQKCVHDRS